MNPQLQQWLDQFQALQSALPNIDPMMLLSMFPPPSGGLPGLTGAGGPSQQLSPLSALLMSTGALGELGLEKGPFDLQMQAAKTAMNPFEMLSRIRSFTRPLSRGLVNAVTRNTMPGVAERGLATSPGMSEQFVAEALAPYQLQEQQMGQQAAFESLGIPFNVGSGTAGAFPADVGRFGLMEGLIGSQA